MKPPRIAKLCLFVILMTCSLTLAQDANDITSGTPEIAFPNVFGELVFTDYIEVAMEKMFPIVITAIAGAVAFLVIGHALGYVPMSLGSYKRLQRTSYIHDKRKELRSKQEKAYKRYVRSRRTRKRNSTRFSKEFS